MRLLLHSYLKRKVAHTDILLLFGRNQSEVLKWAVEYEYISHRRGNHHDYYEITYEDNGRQVSVNKVDNSAEFTTSSPQFDVDDQGIVLAIAQELLITLRNEAKTLREESTSSCTML